MLSNARFRLSFNGRVSWSFYLLAVIVAAALALRLNGLNWDNGYGFHPDERSFYFRADCMYRALTGGISAAAPGDCAQTFQNQPELQTGLPGIGTLLDADRSPLNPKWFPLGSILIYLLVFVRSVLELFGDWGALDLRYAGRTLSALADVGSVLLLFVLGRRLYGVREGLLAAAFAAFAVIHIQHSHFYRPETFTVLFTLASFWAMFRMLERRRRRDSVLLGAMLGLALAPKIAIVPLLAPLAAVFIYRAFDEAGGQFWRIDGAIVRRLLGHAALTGLAALAVFIITTPYALLDFFTFAGDIASQGRMARTAGYWPFTTQYIDTTPLFYQMRQSSFWGLGLPLGIFAWVAIPLTAFLALMLRRTRRADVILLSWVAAFLLFQESFEVRFLRYIFPLMPVLLLLTARLLLWYHDLARIVASGIASRLRLLAPLLAAALLGGVFGGTLFYSLAFQQVYAEEHPASAASEWFRTEAAPYSGIVIDNHWDEFVPGLDYAATWQFPLYEPETPQKMRELAQRLAASDYLVFYSARPYTSASRDPERFPYSYPYYQRLFNGELGYRLHRRFTSYPQFWGVEFQDDAILRAGLTIPEPEVTDPNPPRLSVNFGYADENAVSYDHPTVLVFRNAERLGAAELTRLLVDLAEVNPSSLDPAAVGSLLLPEARLAEQRAGGDFSAAANRQSWANDVPVVTWLLAVEIIYLLTLPLALWLLRWLPDRGMILARILGLLLVSYVAWLLVSAGALDYSRWAVYAGMGLAALLSAAALRWQGAEIRDFLRRRWRLLLAGEALFLAAFLGFTLLRYFNPDLWHPWRGGEKPMELAYLTAVVRSTGFPPYDPWFAGGYLNYYYWGYLIVANLVRITSILPTTAFNLAVPLFFALTVTAAYSLAYNLAAGLLRGRDDAPGDDGPEFDYRVEAIPDSPAAANPSAPGVPTAQSETPPGYPAETGGALSRWRRWAVHPAACGLAAALFVAVIGNLDGLVQIAQGGWQQLAGGGGWPGFDFWRSSRMIPPLDAFVPNAAAFWLPTPAADAPVQSWHITEFPFFTFLFADLHAHLMAIPFTLLAVGVVLCMGLAMREARLERMFVRHISALAVTLGVTVGALFAINSWDYPTYLLLGAAAITMALWASSVPAILKWPVFISLVFGIASISAFSFLPFHLSFEVFNTELSASRWRTPIDRFAGMFGLFLFIAAAYLVVYARRPLAELWWSLRQRGGLPRRMRWLAGLLIFGLLAAVYLAAAGYWTALLLAALLTFTIIAAYGETAHDAGPRHSALFPLALFAAACLLAFGVEFVHIEDGLGRMNTLFKYYLEAWVLMGLAAAFMLWRLASETQFRRGRRWPAAVWAGMAALLLGGSLIYTALGTGDRLADRFNPLPPTLDGTAYMTEAVHWELSGEWDGRRQTPIELRWDREAIQWLQDNVAGTPVVLEAQMDQYRWGGRISAYTGLPTVIGWPWHQIQQRNPHTWAIHQRAADVAAIYGGAGLNRALELLRQYDVSYVVVGQLERALYPPEGLAKFDELAGRGLAAPVFANAGTTIYQLFLPEDARGGGG